MKKTNFIGTNNKADRDKWLASTLGKLKNGSSVLDAGAGEQANKEFCTHLDYTSQDFSQYEGSGDGGALQTGTWDTSKIDIVSDITSIPVENASFDAILCSEVLEHVPYPALVFEEFFRILRSNGNLILTAPFCSLTHFSPYHFYSGFNSYFYEKVLADHGFEIIDIEPNGNYFEYLAQELRRVPTVSEKYSHKKLNPFHRIVVSLCLGLLNKVNQVPNNSHELLCFGYHIHARKKK